MRHIIKIIIIAGITLAISVGLWFYLNRYLLKSKASGEVAKVKFLQTFIKKFEGDVVEVGVLLTTESSTSTNLGISAVDLSFTVQGGNLSYLSAKLPTGYDEQILNDATSSTDNGPKMLKRLMFVSKKPAGKLQKSILIPLSFKVLAAGQPTKSTKITINTTSSMVIGPPGVLYPVTIDPSAPSFTMELFGDKAASAGSLSCDSARNSTRANCGRAVSINWSDASNEEGYKLYRNNVPIKTLGKDASSYNDPWCANFKPVTYAVIAFNEAGSVSTTQPTVSCSCMPCPTAAPPTPTPIQPTSSADLIFRLVFPDALSSVNEIQNVRITILNGEGKRVCDDDTDCAKMVTFTRVPDSRVYNTFQSPQLAYALEKNQAYTVIVKHNHTVRQVYKYVFLKWQKILNCSEGTQDSGCGQLIEEVQTRPLFSGDLDGSNTVDQKDMEIVSNAIGVGGSEGDLNFDGMTDQRDTELLGKNFNKKGT